nr:oxygenase MpaB family protein [Streptomyces sp. TSRI0281]
MMWVAGVRALYLQALHPRAVRGVMQHSDFRQDAWGRLMRTASFVGTITYGTTGAAEAAGARVRKIHRLLKATDPATGEIYGIDEPGLLLWVHCAGRLLPPGRTPLRLPAHRRPGRPLCRLTPRGGAPRRPRPGPRPRLRRTPRAYFDRVRPELRAGEEAFAVDGFLRGPPVHTLLVPARALLWRRVAALAYQSLPPYAHELYGRPAPPPHVVDRRLRATGALLRAISARLRRQLPPGHIPKAMARLGPDSRPTPYKLRSQAAILDGPGRAQQ